MKIAIIPAKNSKNLEIVLFKYSKMEDVVLFDVLNFSDVTEPPEYLREMLKYALRERFIRKFKEEGQEIKKKEKD